MKHLFAKYLSVKGEIKEGDKVLYNGKVYLAPYGKAYILEGLILDTQAQIDSLQKVKLFLCSRDIKIGDNGYNTVTNSFHLLNEPLEHYHGLGDIWIKVIGEISPEATWVKEGDEFDEDEIEEWTIDTNNKLHPPHGLSEIQKSNLKKIYKVKGPCGHFH